MLVDQEWYQKHKNDVTQEQIDSLGIEVIVDGKRYPEIKQGNKKDKLKKIISCQAAG